MQTGVRKLLVFVSTWWAVSCSSLSCCFFTRSNNFTCCLAAVLFCCEPPEMLCGRRHNDWMFFFLFSPLPSPPPPPRPNLCCNQMQEKYFSGKVGLRIRGAGKLAWNQYSCQSLTCNCAFFNQTHQLVFLSFLHKNIYKINTSEREPAENLTKEEGHRRKWYIKWWTGKRELQKGVCGCVCVRSISCN